jgi:hypothetical protein
MYSSPKDRIFARILKVIREVIAIVVKKVRKSNCEYIGNVISIGKTPLPTKRSP